jgi:superoxide dismutase, Fe-Mn family
MAFELPELPYDKNALAPHISEETLEYHYGKHHQAYVNKLNDLLPGSQFEKSSLEDIIMQADGGIFNNAAQIWNHTFYWHSMSPKGGNSPSSALTKELEKAFGSVDTFKENFTEAGMTQFGSGWAWLVKNNDGKLEVVKTLNANNPMTDGKTPLLTCDVWEHAYYIDTRNDRGKYINNFWNVVNWEFVEKNLG